MQAVVLHRLHVFAVHTFGPALDAHHHGLAGAVDVGVEQADAGAFGSQRQRQVDGGGAFADAALAGGHGHDILHVGQQLHAALHAVAGNFETHVDRHIAHTGHAFGGIDQQLADTGELAFRRVAEFDVESHIITADLQVPERFAADKILAGVGVQHALQGAQDGLLFYCHGGKSPGKSDKAGPACVLGDKSNAAHQTRGPWGIGPGFCAGPT